MCLVLDILVVDIFLLVILGLGGLIVGISVIGILVQRILAHDIMPLHMRLLSRLEKVVILGAILVGIILRHVIFHQLPKHLLLNLLRYHRRLLQVFYLDQYHLDLGYQRELYAMMRRLSLSFKPYYNQEYYTDYRA